MGNRSDHDEAPRDPSREPTDSIDETVESVSGDEIKSDQLGETVAASPSVMDSPRIDATINPRELSPRDAASWHEATVDLNTILEQTLGAPTDVTSVDDKVSKPEQTIQYDPSAKTEPKISFRRSERKTVGTGPLSQSGLSRSGSGARTGTDLQSSIPAIRRTIAEHGLNQLRVCEITDAELEWGETEVGEADDKSDKEGDYRLVKKLGQGGMGDVYRAEQLSLGRLLAIKVMRPIEGGRRRKLEQTGRLDEVEAERRLQFLTEARVTGDLDHPNIVPIHDVAMTSEGEIFYSMKQVVGTPWSEILHGSTREKNLEVLLRVCDAIAFAHTRGVVHRDIKPENIMLGDFGVVLVMDWGLALPTDYYSNEINKSVLATTGLGGTPAFMAPEMARGPIDKIGPAADVYLLGATLYLIVTGRPPHHAPNVTECLKRVKANHIREAPPECHGELLDIALKAMATEPADRYAGVLELQNAIREYQQHAGSIDQGREAYVLLEQASQNAAYETFSKATFKFEEAIASWDGNEEAKQGWVVAKRCHAEKALKKGDFDLADSLLKSPHADFDDLRERVRREIVIRDSRESRLRVLRMATAALLMFILVGGSIAIIVINQRRSEALIAQQKAIQAAEDERIAREEADQSRVFAEAKRKEAEQRRSEAIAAKQDAEEQKTMAEKARDEATEANRIAQVARTEAEQAQQKESYESFLSKINLAKARLDDNDVAGAKQILQPLRRHALASGWEFRWLWRQVSVDHAAIDVGEGIIDASYSTNGKVAVVLTTKGTIHKVVQNDPALNSDQASVSKKTTTTIEEIEWSSSSVTGSSVTGHPTAVAWIDRSETIVVGTSEGEILHLSPSGRRRIFAHDSAINDLATVGHWVVTASEDRGMKLWDVSGTSSIKQVANTAWHLAPAKRLAVESIRVMRPDSRAPNQESLLIASVSPDDRGGSITLWKINVTDIKKAKLDQLGQFNGHQRPVSSVAIRADGGLVASGDVDGNLFVWKTNRVREVDFQDEIQDALAGKPKAPNRVIKFLRLVDDAAADGKTIVALPRTPTSPQRAHSDGIESIDFSDDGKLLVSGARDFTMKTWDLERAGRVDVFRGHEGSILKAQFVSDPAEQSILVSAASDGCLRNWDTENNVKDAVEQTVSPEDASVKTAHSRGITSAVFSRGGSRVLTSSADHTAKIFTLDPQTYAFTNSVSLRDEVFDEGTPYVAMSIGVDREGERLFVANADASVRVWDRHRGVELARVAGTGLSQAMALSSNGKWLLTGSSQKKERAILWKIDDHGSRLRLRKAQVFAGHDQMVTAMAVSHDGTLVFTGDSVGYGVLWDKKTGDPLGKPIETVRGFRINAAEFDAEGKTLWLAADDDQLTQVDLVSRKRVDRLPHEGVVKDFAFTDDGSTVLTLSELRTERDAQTWATIWNVSGRQKRVLKQVSSRIDHLQITSIDLTLDGDAAMVACHGTAETGGNTRSVLHVFEPDDRDTDLAKRWPSKPTQRLQLPQRVGAVAGIRCLNRGQCSTINGNAVYRWNLKDGRLLKSYRPHSVVTRSDFSFDEKFVLTASRGVKVWNAETGEAVAKLEQPHHGPVWCIASVSSSDEKAHFITGGDDGFLKRWVFTPEDQSIQLVGHWNHPAKEPVRFAVVAPNQKWALFGGDRGTASLVRLDNKDPQVISLALGDAPNLFETPGVNFLCGAFSDDALVLGIGASDKRVRLWDIREIEQSGAPKPISEFRDHSDRVLDLKLVGTLGSGIRGYSVSADDSIRVWDPGFQRTENRIEVEDFSARQWLQLKRHTRDVTAIDFSEGADLMMTAGKDGKVFLWPAGTR